MLFFGGCSTTTPPQQGQPGAQGQAGQTGQAGQPGDAGQTGQAGQPGEAGQTGQPGKAGQLLRRALVINPYDGESLSIVERLERR